MAEFQVVLLAGGPGSRMYPLSVDIPKAMLPVGNVPMIAYILRTLQQARFSEVIIVMEESQKATIAHFLAGFVSDTIKIVYHTFSESQNLGTADVLRTLKDKINRDFFVLSCDLITNVGIHLLADLHRSNNAAVTCLLAKPPVKSEQEAAVDRKLSQMDKGANDYVGLDSRSGQIVLFASQADFEPDEPMNVKAKVLRAHPTIDLHANIMDAHFYIFSKWVLDFVVAKTSISSIHTELIPYLVRKQFSKPKDKKDKGIDIYSFVPPCPFERRESKTIKCFALLVEPKEDLTCTRANTLNRYADINRSVLKLKDALLGDQPAPKPGTQGQNTQISADSLVDTGVVIGDDCVVKKSIVGEHCKIGNRTRILNSVIMKHVTIEDDCTITNSIICNSATIRTKATLATCQVGTEYDVPSDTNAKNEALLAMDDKDDGDD